MSWINVKDKLPENSRKVLAVFSTENGNQFRICAHFTREGESEVYDFDEHDSYAYYDEEKDKYFYHEGWYENIENWGDFSSIYVCEGEVTHLMDLPESPNRDKRKGV